MKPVIKVVLFLSAFCAFFTLALNLPRNSQCDLENLLLQDDMMPSRWKRKWRVLPPVLPKDGAQDALNVVYENGNELAFHTIFRYKNGSQAYLFLRINHRFPSGLIRWTDLAGSADWELFGDEDRIECGESDDPLLGFRCAAVVRYGQFISDFSSPIGAGILSQEEFEAIVLDIDYRIKSCLQRN